jgi:hypothetical protein
VRALKNRDGIEFPRGALLLRGCLALNILEAPMFGAGIVELGPIRPILFRKRL